MALLRVCVQVASLERRRGPGLLSVPPRRAFGALLLGSGCLPGDGLGAPGGSLGRLSRGRGEGPLGQFPWSPVLGTGGQAAGPVGWAMWILVARPQPCGEAPEPGHGGERG